MCVHVRWCKSLGVSQNEFYSDNLMELHATHILSTSIPWVTILLLIETLWITVIWYNPHDLQCMVLNSLFLDLVSFPLTTWPWGSNENTSGVRNHILQVCPLNYGKEFTRCGVRTHADIRPLDLKSNALTTRPIWFLTIIILTFAGDCVRKRSCCW